MPNKQPSKFDEEATITSQMLLEESDRGCAIFGAQIINDRLEEFLMSIFRSDKEGQKIGLKLFRGYGPLATFSARLDIGLALGAIPSDHYRSAQIIRKIRNRMAHEPGPITFEHRRVKLLFRLLVSDGKSNDQDNGEPVTVELPSGTRSFSRAEITNRISFIVAVSRLIGGIDFNIALFQKMSDEPLWIRFLQTVPREEIQNIEV